MENRYEEIFVDKVLSNEYFQLMNGYREQNMFCDVILKVKQSLNTNMLY